MKKQWLIRISLGGVLGALLAPGLVWLASSLGVSGGRLVPPDMVQCFGTAAAAAVVQSLLGGILGALAAVATLPFADEGRALVLRSLGHFAATECAFALLLWVCRWVERGRDVLLWMCLMAVLYGVIWLGRWVGWYLEVEEIRDRLGLSPTPSPLRWRETAAYLPFLLLVCDLLPLALGWLDRKVVVDVPVLSGLLLPFVLLPAAGFCSGLSLGKRKGFCPLYPAACFVCYLPMVWVLFNSSALFHCFMAAVPALAGNLAGAAYRRERRSV